MRYLNYLFLLLILSSPALVQAEDITANDAAPNEVSNEMPDAASQKIIGGKPASEYLADPNVSLVAKAYYKGTMQVSNNDDTRYLMMLPAKTDKDELRPFYVYCLNNIIRNSDISLDKATSASALLYIIKYPREFLSEVSNSFQKGDYGKWVDLIGREISSLKESDKKVAEDNIADKIKASCTGCDAATLSNIDKFSDDVKKIADTTQ